MSNTIDAVLFDPSTYVDPLRTFVPTFFPHIITQHFPDGTSKITQSPEFHQEIIDVLKEQHPRTLIVAPRGSAKSTLCSFVWALYTSVYGLSPFTILVSDSHKKAVSFLSKIKRELEDNRFLRDVYGIRLGTPWSSDDITFTLGWLNNQRVRIVARGVGQSLRGYIDDVRPTLIILDDVETDQNCMTADRREKLRDWFWTGVIPTIDPYIGKVITVGTIVHSDSLLSRFIQNPPDNWVIRKYAILNDDGTPLWPERFTLEMIQNIKDEYIRQGMVHKFYQEYLNDPVGLECQTFDINKLRPYDTFKLPYDLRTFMAVDFGATTGSESDYTVIMAGSASSSGDIYIREYVRDRLKPSEIMEAIFMMYEKYNASVIGIETNGQQKAYYYMLEDMCRDRNKYLKLYAINHKIPKDQRILTLQPLVDSNKIYYIPTMTDLLEEFRAFPRGKHDDVIDALSNLYITMREFGATRPKQRYTYTSSNTSAPTIFMP